MPTGTIHCMAVVSHPTKFRKVQPNSVNVVIAGVKNWSLGARPLCAGVASTMLWPCANPHKSSSYYVYSCLYDKGLFQKFGFCKTDSVGVDEIDSRLRHVVSSCQTCWL